MKAAIAVIDAPLLTSDAARGNEINAGMCKIAPTIATRRIPLNPDCLPINLEISAAGTNPISKPIKTMRINTIGRMRKNDLNAIINDRCAFSLSLIKAKTKQLKAKIFIKMTVELINSPVSPPLDRNLCTYHTWYISTYLFPEQQIPAGSLRQPDKPEPPDKDDFVDKDL